jgi:effector-binding domain-containing protein
MKALKVLAWIIGVLAALFLILLFAAPSHLHVERSVQVNAPLNVVWEHLVKFENFNKWSTWRQADTAAVYTISGTDGTEGASTSWDGKKIGKGKLEHISLTPYKTIKQKIYFYTPVHMEADVFFELEDTDGKTKVTWGFDGDYDRPQNILGMFMKGALEKDFQQGLDNMKNAVEKHQPATANSKWPVKETDFPTTTFAMLRKEVRIKDIDKFITTNLPAVYEAVMAAKLAPGTPTGLIFSWDENTGKTDMAAAIPVPADSKAGAGYQLYTLPASKGVYVDFYGPYEKTYEAHAAIDTFLKAANRKQKWPVLEQYITDPASEPDTTKWLTKVIYLSE